MFMRIDYMVSITGLERLLGWKRMLSFGRYGYV
jgi:hypothetical protein